MKINIGANIKRLRTEKNITQEQLSVSMNVTCAAVSKWERGETYPDITLLQPLAYYFGVSLDELMGYDQEKIQADIDEIISLYKKYWTNDYKKARELITKAYRDYPNDYWIMHYYMWNIGGDMADNDPNVLIAHKSEFLSICNKILDGCTEETLRLNAWNMRAKILHAEGNTEAALNIYRDKFTNWYHTSGQKTEQLFPKDSDEYYFWVSKNMYELIAFAGYKLASVVFFDSSLPINEKAIKAIKFGKLMLNNYNETKEPFFICLANAFLSRMRNYLQYRGGNDEDIIAVTDMNLCAAKIISDLLNNNEPLQQAIFPQKTSVKEDSYLECVLNNLLAHNQQKRLTLLNNPNYIAVINKYK